MLIGASIVRHDHNRQGDTANKPMKIVLRPVKSATTKTRAYLDRGSNTQHRKLPSCSRLRYLEASCASQVLRSSSRCEHESMAPKNMLIFCIGNCMSNVFYMAIAHEVPGEAMRTVNQSRASPDCGCLLFSSCPACQGRRDFLCSLSR